MSELNIDLSFINTDPFLLFFGSFYVILGASIFLAGNAWREFIDLFIKNDAISLILGVFTLPMALFIIVFYNDYSTLGATILMVMGWIGLIKSVALFLFPSVMQKFLDKGLIQKYLWVDGLSGIALGVGMLVL